MFACFNEFFDILKYTQDINILKTDFQNDDVLESNLASP